MGAVTGSVGGIIRDTLGHVPSVLLGHEIYITASVLGACTYVASTDSASAAVGDGRRVSRDLRRPQSGDELGMVGAGVPRIDHARALEEPAQGPGGIVAATFKVVINRARQQLRPP